MTAPVMQLEATLAANRLSTTAPRRHVFQALLEGDPLTMAELVSRCLPQTNRASVYRTVSLYERLGIIHRLQVGWKYKLELSDKFQHHHHHMHCTACGLLISFAEDSILEERLRKIATGASFVPADHLLEIRGRCNRCSQETKNPARMPST